MSNYDPWRSQGAAHTQDAMEYSRSPRSRTGAGGAYGSPSPSPIPSNMQPYTDRSPRSPNPSALSAPRGSSMDSRRQQYGGTPGLADEKKPLGMKHSDSTGTLADEYEDALDKGYKPSKQTRGSMAVQMAATGEIPKKAGLRLWRSEEHSGTFLRGGKRRACLRCFVCSFIIALLVVIAVIVGFLLWVRPPSVTFQGVETPAGVSEVVVINGGFQLNFNLLIGVINPNYFGAFFPILAAKAFYPTSSQVELGGGQMINVDIHKRTNNTIHFPFQINYTSAIDPGNAILTDIANKCGFIQGSTKQNIKVNYSLLLKIRVLAVDISPSFSSSTTFACPLQESDIDNLLKAGGVAGIISETSGSSTSSASGPDRRSLPELAESKRDLEDVLHGLARRTWLPTIDAAPPRT